MTEDEITAKRNKILDDLESKPIRKHSFQEKALSPEELKLIHQFKQCFSTESGQAVLAYLKKYYRMNSKVYAPNMTHANLAYMEGQRDLIIDIVEIINRKEK